MTDIREQEMQNRIDSLTLEKENLRYEIDFLKEQIDQLKKMAFGSRTEKTKRVLGEVEEINIFDEAEVEAKGSASELVIEVPAHQRHKKQKGHLEQILKDVPHEECVITLPEDERICKRCGTLLTSMGREKIRTEVQFIPATVKGIDFYRESLQCLDAGKRTFLHRKAANAAAGAVQVHRFAIPRGTCHCAEIPVFHADLPSGRGVEIHWHSLFPSHSSQLGDSGSKRLAHAAGRLEKDKLEAFFAWLEEIQPKTLPKSALGKAVSYVLNHRKGGQRIFAGW